MTFRNALILFSFLAFFASASSVMAKPKPWPFSWGPGHDEWTAYKKYNPHLENGKHSHNTQWQGRDWYVEDWLSQSRSGLTLINGFYRANILKDQDVDDDIPVLVVGPEFYRLSGYDKRRVAHTVDVVYGITRGKPNGTFILKDWHTKLPIGIYTEYGLQLQ